MILIFSISSSIPWKFFDNMLDIFSIHFSFVIFCFNILSSVSYTKILYNVNWFTILYVLQLLIILTISSSISIFNARNNNITGIPWLFSINGINAYITPSLNFRDSLYNDSLISVLTESISAIYTSLLLSFSYLKYILFRAILSCGTITFSFPWTIKYPPFSYCVFLIFFRFSVQ